MKSLGLHMYSSALPPSLAFAVVQDQLAVGAIAIIQVLHDLVRRWGKRLVNIQELKSEKKIISTKNPSFNIVCDYVYNLQEFLLGRVSGTYE